ncbi:hypothetical protein [Moraxella marmotae]|uniref:hypothetical protein n=1 Tax=Moraxella marmotae TaxID=3344520 RepID=UPI0035F24773
MSVLTGCVTLAYAVTQLPESINTDTPFDITRVNKLTGEREPMTLQEFAAYILDTVDLSAIPNIHFENDNDDDKIIPFSPTVS